jgi:hypothetical protein
MAAFLKTALVAVLIAQPALTVDRDAAIITILVKPDHVTSFEHVLDKLKSSLQRSTNPQRKAQAAGWQVFKTDEQVQGHASYVMRLDPFAGDLAYDIPRILSEELPNEAAELTRAYRDAHVGQSVLVMTRLDVPGLGEPTQEHMSTAVTPAGLPVLSFDSAHAVVMTVLIRPERTADFEATLSQLGKALQASRTPGRKLQAAGWKVYKGTQPFGGNIPYVVSLDPVLHRVEYDPMRLIQETYPADVDALFKKYREAYVGQAITRLTVRIEMLR